MIKLPTQTALYSEARHGLETMFVTAGQFYVSIVGSAASGNPFAWTPTHFISQIEMPWIFFQDEPTYVEVLIIIISVICISN